MGIRRSQTLRQADMHLSPPLLESIDVQDFTAISKELLVWLRLVPFNNNNNNNNNNNKNKNNKDNDNSNNNNITVSSSPPLNFTAFLR